MDRFVRIATLDDEVQAEALDAMLSRIQINSASYWWLNNPAARRETYPPEVHKGYPYLTHVAAYREPLWALVTLDLDRGEVAIKGRRTRWVGPDPWARGEQVPWSREQLRPAISSRRLRLNT